MTRSNTIPIALGDSMTDTQNSPSLLSSQLGFLARFPSDIILEIFTHLTKKDCLACMAVCRAWYHSTPQYTQSCWKTLQLETRDVYTENQCVIRSLGEHVENVILIKFTKDKSLYYAVDKLLSWRCTKIKSLELRTCGTNDQSVFLNTLAKLAPHLTSLSLVDHGSNVSFLHVFKACPRLTRFTYMALPKRGMNLDRDPSVYDKEPMMPEMEAPIGPFLNIEHLHLDVGLHRQLRLNPILQRCPNLRSFVGATIEAGYDSSTSPRSIAMDFNLLLNWCPKISCVSDALSYYYRSELDDSSFHIGNEFKGLRHLGVSNAYERATIIQLLTKSQHTLEYLSVRPFIRDDNTIDWISLLKSFQLTQLKTLILSRLQLDLASVIAICNQCPVLERLDLKRVEFAHDQQGIQSFRPIHQIRYLRLDCLFCPSDISLPIILEQFPSLEAVSLHDLVLPINYPEVNKCRKQLKKLTLSGITWASNNNGGFNSYDGPRHLLNWFSAQSKLEEVIVQDISKFCTCSLSALASISTLKSIDIWLKDLDCGPAEEADLNNFAMLLNETVIEKIRIETFWHIPDEITSKLKRLPLLKKLEMYHLWDHICCKNYSK